MNSNSISSGLNNNEQISNSWNSQYSNNSYFATTTPFLSTQYTNSLDSEKQLPPYNPVAGINQRFHANYNFIQSSPVDLTKCNQETNSYVHTANCSPVHSTSDNEMHNYNGKTYIPTDLSKFNREGDFVTNAQKEELKPANSNFQKRIKNEDTTFKNPVIK